MNFDRLSKLSDLFTNDLKRKPTIILDPNPDQSYRMIGTANDVNVSIDIDNWVIPEELKPFILELAKDECNSEEKILKIYQKLCEDYTYDDNVLSYIRKNDDDTFYLPDNYGRNSDLKWKENRKLHNRRSCFEISRILAKSISEILRLNGTLGNYDVCILYDEAVTHYLVGLACNDYYISLDLDDFTQIKDLTRMKTGLTLEGIKVLEDESSKFEAVLKNFNKGREKFAKDHIKNEREKFNHELSVNTNNEATINDNISSDDINFIKHTIQILKEDYNLDSAGVYEYLKEIVDTKIGARSRKKVWKEVENNPGVGTRYTRCLIVTIDDVQYIIDVTKENTSEIFRKFNQEELNGPDAKITPFKEMSRDWDEDPYDGR